jgi:hypothetical protein
LGESLGEVRDAARIQKRGDDVGTEDLIVIGPSPDESDDVNRVDWSG